MAAFPVTVIAADAMAADTTSRLAIDNANSSDQNRDKTRIAGLKQRKRNTKLETKCGLIKNLHLQRPVLTRLRETYSASVSSRRLARSISFHGSISKILKEI
jgi:hypothetical protein